MPNQIFTHQINIFIEEILGKIKASVDESKEIAEKTKETADKLEEIADKSVEIAEKIEEKKVEIACTEEEAREYDRLVGKYPNIKYYHKAVDHELR